MEGRSESWERVPILSHSHLLKALPELREGRKEAPAPLPRPDQVV